MSAVFAYSALMNKIKPLFLLTLVLLQLRLPSAQARVAQFEQLPNSSTVQFGRSLSAGSLSGKSLRLLVWNIHKGTDEKLPHDFATVSHAADLTLIQEAISEKSFTTRLSTANPNLTWTLAISFELSKNNYTGVATGSVAQPLLEEAIVSDVTEPILHTPKTVLLSEFRLEGREETLLVANIHGINFVTNDDFKIQIRQMLKKIYRHQGPLIIAGDFNTWNEGRTEYLHKALAPLKVRLVQTPDSGGLFNLDHIFVRGFAPRFVFNLNHINSSDHKPLLVDFIFE